MNNTDLLRGPLVVMFAILGGKSGVTLQKENFEWKIVTTGARFSSIF